MATISQYKGRSSFVTKLRVNGTRKTLSLGDNKTLAQHIANNVELIIAHKEAKVPFTPDLIRFIDGADKRILAKLAEWKLINPSQGKTMLNLLDAFINELSLSDNSQNYLKDINSINSKCIDSCTFILPSDIETDDIMEYFTKLKTKVAARTYNKHLQAIKQFFKWLKRKKLTQIDLSMIPKLNVKLDRRIIRRALSHENVNKLLVILNEVQNCKGMSEKDKVIHRLTPFERKLIYMFAIYHGLRWNEIRSLKIVDIDLNQKKFVIQAKNEKAKRGAVLPLNDILATELSKYLTEPIRPADELVFKNCWVDKGAAMLRKDLELAGIDWRKDIEGTTIDFHALRHTCGTLLAHECTPQVLADMMRHSSYDLTKQYYVHLDVESLRGVSNSFQNRDLRINGRRSKKA